MAQFRQYLFSLLILLVGALSTACGPLLTPVRTSGEAPTPIVRYEIGGTDDPNVFVDHEPFQAALIKAIQSRDEALLKRLMAENFVSGWWRGEMGDLPQADALRELYQDQLGDPIAIQLAPKVDLPALMGGTNPLDIPRREANVVNAFVVSGWGKDGKDEAILFVSRQPDNSLRWAGTLVVKGGFTSPETGGVQPFANTDLGFQMYLPLGYETKQFGEEIMVYAPQGTEGHRERAMITVEQASGRTAEQMAAELIADQGKAGLPAEFSAQTPTVMGLDTEMAVIVERVPSQDMQRVLFVVHNDRLYKMIFIPNDANAGEAYQQMRNVYGVIVNTFKFLQGPDADLDVYLNLLGKALAEQNKTALQSMIGEPFTLAFWQSEGMQISQAQAFQQILNNYAPAGARLTLDPHDPLIARLYPDPLKSAAGEDLIPVLVTGWGAEGKNEAILFIARRADGSLYWQGAMTALGGFKQ